MRMERKKRYSKSERGREKKEMVGDVVVEDSESKLEVGSICVRRGSELRHGRECI